MAADLIANDTAPERDTADNLSAITVLFVDDEPTLLRTIARALEGCPYEILTAHGPGDALAVLESRHVDVLVSDIDMPEMTGVELVQLARRDHPQTLRMLITGNATMEKALHAINEGEVLRFFTKPFDPDLFLETMEKLVERIEELRGDAGEDLRRARREELSQWLASRYPGATFVDRNEDGEVMIDLSTLLSAVDEIGVPLAKDLLRREG